MNNMIGVFDSVSYEASRPSSWEFGVPIINPFSGKEATENEVKIVKELYDVKNNERERYNMVSDYEESEDEDTVESEDK